MADLRIPWEQPFHLGDGEGARLNLGPIELTVVRHAHEWRVAYVNDADHLRDDVAVTCPDPTVDLEDAPTLQRYPFASAPETFTLTARLADRALIIRPTQPLRLLGGGAVDVFVSTPVWLVISAGGQQLVEIPSSRPSDTWFGVNTLSGELCYASRTTARLALAELPMRTTRAVTRIHLTNARPEPVLFERVHLPAPQLQLFKDPEGGLWTQPVDLAIDAGGTASVRFDSSPSTIAPAAVPFGAPRVVHGERHVLARALSALWT